MDRTRILEYLTLIFTTMWVSILIASKIPSIIDLYFMGATIFTILWIADSHYHLLRLIKFMRNIFEEVESPLLSRRRGG